MACNTESKEIGDHEYSVTQWNASKAMLIKFKLVKIFGATLAILAGSSNSKNKSKKFEEDAKSLGDGLSMLFQNNSPDDILALMKECIIGASCDGSKITSFGFEELFSGDSLLEVYQVFIFVIQVNYSNLMKGQKAQSILTKIQESL